MEIGTHLSEALNTHAMNKPGTPGNSPSNSNTNSGTIYKSMHTNKWTNSVPGAMAK